MLADNPCPIDFEEPPAVEESREVTLRCSTSPSCPSKLQIHSSGLVMASALVKEHATFSFATTWQDNRRTFSCQTDGNTDKYLVRTVSLTVEYPPTELNLIMDPEVSEGQLSTISCTADSVPPSTLTLTRTTASGLPSSKQHVIKEWEHNNTLSYTFNASSNDAGFYTCDASNTVGNQRSRQRKLVVRYSPKYVTVQAHPGLVVNEYSFLRLRCSAEAHPPVTSVTWMKMIDGKDEVLERSPDFTLESVKVSDSGPYSCVASNEIGTGKSERAEVKVKHGPKHVKITRYSEQQLPDGLSSVLLSCRSPTYPPIKQYLWYMKREGNKGDLKVSDYQNFTALSDQPGVYYCIAQNEISLEKSDPERLFLDRGFMNALRPFFICLFILLLILIIIFIFRRQNKPDQQRALSMLSCCGCLDSRNSTSQRNLMSEPALAETCRSRCDLLSDQPHRPKVQPCDPCPDSTAASNINVVYSNVKPPLGKQGISEGNRQRGGHTEEDSVNYASLQFGNKQVGAGADVMYAVLRNPTTKGHKEDLEHYENMRSNPVDDDTDDTSEDEIEVSYSHVNFKNKVQH
ncbi:B-cell receptor CD22-like [Aulostomus maculatus]